MRLRFLDCVPLPGAEKLLSELSRSSSISLGTRIPLALVSSTKSQSYELKISRPETKGLLDVFQSVRGVLGDDPRVRTGQGKPGPDIHLVALQTLNSSADTGANSIKRYECLVFEESIAGVEAGRRAGMRVVWVPHLDVAIEYHARRKDVLAGRTGLIDIGDDWQLGKIDDGWTESIQSLENFNYNNYGIGVLS